MSLLEGAHERDKEALQTHQDRLRELELGSWRASDPEPGETLGDELDNGDSGQESKAEWVTICLWTTEALITSDCALRSDNCGVRWRCWK